MSDFFSKTTGSKNNSSQKDAFQKKMKERAAAAAAEHVDEPEFTRGAIWARRFLTVFVVVLMVANLGGLVFMVAFERAITTIWVEGFGGALGYCFAGCTVSALGIASAYVNTNRKLKYFYLCGNAIYATMSLGVTIICIMLASKHFEFEKSFHAMDAKDTCDFQKHYECTGWLSDCVTLYPDVPATQAPPTPTQKKKGESPAETPKPHHYLDSQEQQYRAFFDVQSTGSEAPLPGCRTLLDCNHCLQNPNCGWCSSAETPNCDAGSINGPNEGSCPGWQYTSCSATNPPSPAPSSSPSGTPAPSGTTTTTTTSPETTTTTTSATTDAPTTTTTQAPTTTYAPLVPSTASFSSESSDASLTPPAASSTTGGSSTNQHSGSGSSTPAPAAPSGSGSTPVAPASSSSAGSEGSDNGEGSCPHGYSTSTSLSFKQQVKGGSEATFNVDPCSPGTPSSPCSSSGYVQVIESAFGAKFCTENFNSIVTPWAPKSSSNMLLEGWDATTTNNNNWTATFSDHGGNTLEITIGCVENVPSGTLEPYGDAIKTLTPKFKMAWTTVVGSSDVCPGNTPPLPPPTPSPPPLTSAPSGHGTPVPSSPPPSPSSSSGGGSDGSGSGDKPPHHSQGGSSSSGGQHPQDSSSGSPLTAAPSSPAPPSPSPSSSHHGGGNSGSGSRSHHHSGGADSGSGTHSPSEKPHHNPSGSGPSGSGASKHHGGDGGSTSKNGGSGSGSEGKHQHHQALSPVELQFQTECVSCSGLSDKSLKTPCVTAFLDRVKVHAILVLFISLGLFVASILTIILTVRSMIEVEDDLVDGARSAATGLLN